jgi:hypothetical protein
MAKKTWIKIKRGLLEPKHRFALGELIYLYLYILDMVNWESGIIEEWLDSGISEELEMPLSTLRDQRAKLEKLGYISTERKQHGIRLIVHNWTNPREYSGEEYNKKKIPSHTPSNTPSHTPSNTPSNTPSDTPSIKAPEEISLLPSNHKSQITESQNHSFNNNTEFPISSLELLGVATPLITRELKSWQANGWSKESIFKMIDDLERQKGEGNITGLVISLLRKVRPKKYWSIKELEADAEIQRVKSWEGIAK